MENKNSSGCKLPLLVSGLALILASAAYFCPKKTGSDIANSSTLDEKVKGIVVDMVRQNPQLIMDAMGEGIAKKREDAMKQLSSDVLGKSSEISQQALKFGDMAAKTSVVCFFDPLCKHCVDFQQSMIKLVKAKTNVCFKMLPVGVLGDDSITLSKIYIAAYDKSPEKAVTFIEKITSTNGEVDKSAIEKALKAAGLDGKEIEGMIDDSDKKLIANGKLAEALKIPVVPAIFMIKGKEAKLIQTVNPDELLSFIEEKSE